MKNILIITTITILFLLSSCTDNKNQVIVYTSVDQIFSEPILKEYKKTTGIEVKVIYDTEETKSTGVLNRLIAEKDNPICDVFWSGDPVRPIVLKNKDILQKYIPVNAKNINPIYKSKNGYWTGFSARARVLIYNKDSVSDSMIPESIFDLTNSKYDGKFAIANPLFGTTTFHIAAIFTAIGAEKAKIFLQELKQNNVVIATSNGDVKKRVINGEVWLGLTDTDDAYEAIKEGANIGVVFLDQDGIGSLIMPNSVCLIKNSPNQENGKKIIDYLLSKETEAKLAESCAQMPLHKNVEIPEYIPSLDNIKPMNIDYDKTSKELENIQQYLKEWAEN